MVDWSYSPKSLAYSALYWDASPSYSFALVQVRGRSYARGIL
jgi:hypothetical protein